MSFLVANGLSKSFGAFQAVGDVDLSVEKGERRALIGPNGAGKTTLFNLLTGMLAPDRGTVHVGGRSLTGLRPHDIAAAGLTRAFQVTSIFGRLTVRQNVQAALLAVSGGTRRLWGDGWRSHRLEADALLAEVGLADVADVAARTISHGDQRALELAIAIALDPVVLLLDEPTAGMAPAETAHAMALIRRVIEERSITLLFCEHDMDVVFGTADRVTVMHQGRVLVEGEPEEIRGHPQVQEVYLGTVAA
jgi:branched-chain amino acid transport system ATP-binding protein